MKQTVLHQKHLQSKVKTADFQGWQVPQAYTEIQDEYYAVRNAAGLFDVGFLGRIEITGANARDFLQQLFTRNIDRMADHSAHYGFFCNNQGGILDDSVLFRLTEERFLLSTNAVNTEKILTWLEKHSPAGLIITDLSQTMAQLSLQGPRSGGILEKMLHPHFKKFRPRAVREISFLDTNVLISRTGYSGEDGYEFFIPAEKAEELWDSIMNAGNEYGIMKCGIASRDILRIEMGYLHYGNDIDERRTPFEAGYERFVDLKKDFIGRQALIQVKTEGVKQKLAGFMLIDKSVPRGGGSIFSENRVIGAVTSGTISPALRKGIGLGYVVSRYAQPGQEIEIEIRDREIAARIVELPFSKRK
jgi:aminomethyltransferase